MRRWLTGMALALLAPAVLAAAAAPQLVVDGQSRPMVASGWSIVPETGLR